MNLDQAFEPQNTTRMVDHKAAVDEIMACEDLGRLAQILVGLERRAGQLDVQLSIERTRSGIAAGRAEKRVAVELMTLTRQRVKLLTDATARANHNFREIARQVLSPATFNAIDNEASFPMKRG